MIGIVNYGLGNVQAFVNIYKRLNIETVVVSSSAELSSVDRIILPGVGAFDWAMTRLNESGIRATLDEFVLLEHMPVLGICVGMQMMAKRSEEGKLDGLGWVDAEVRRFVEASSNHNRYLPHMGWNDVMPCKENGLFKGLEKGARFYFLHSYCFFPCKQEDVLSYTDYNEIFASAVCSKNIFGVQFHPEKSHHAGIRLLTNFAEL